MGPPHAKSPSKKPKVHAKSPSKEPKVPASCGKGVAGARKSRASDGVQFKNGHAEELGKACALQNWREVKLILESDWPNLKRLVITNILPAVYDFTFAEQGKQLVLDENQEALVGFLKERTEDLKAILEAKPQRQGLSVLDKLSMNPSENLQKSYAVLVRVLGIAHYRIPTFARQLLTLARARKPFRVINKKTLAIEKKPTGKAWQELNEDLYRRMVEAANLSIAQVIADDPIGLQLSELGIEDDVLAIVRFELVKLLESRLVKPDLVAGVLTFAASQLQPTAEGLDSLESQSEQSPITPEQGDLAFRWGKEYRTSHQANGGFLSQAQTLFEYLERFTTACKDPNKPNKEPAADELDAMAKRFLEGFTAEKPSNPESLLRYLQCLECWYPQGSAIPLTAQMLYTLSLWQQAYLHMPKPAPSTQHPAPSTQHPAPSTQHPAPSTQPTKTF